MAAANQPVIIGVGQVHNRSEDPADIREPLELLADAVTAAAEDTGAPKETLGAIDAVDVVNVVSWVYEDLPAQLAARLDVAPNRTFHSDWGGNKPTEVIDAAASRIASGQSHAVVVAGGEAFRSLERAVKGGGMPAWTPPPEGAQMINPSDLTHPVAWAHGLRMPVHVYPLYENGSRSAMGMSLADAQAWSARIWSDFSHVAAANPGAWNPTPMSPEEIATPSAENRMISHPYPKLMNALLSVDQAAAVVMTDVATAERLGVPEDRWVHPWGGAGANDPHDVLDRTSYDRSPAMQTVFDDVFDVAGLALSDVDLLELYSCFPCVPKMASHYLGLDRDRRLSVTGGLTFYGGAGNAYMLCAMVAMVEALRRGDGDTAMLYGQGGMVTKHHALVVARHARPDGAYPIPDDRERQARVDGLKAPELAANASGPGKIESYTVVYDRDGSPKRGIVVGLLEEGRRFAANTTDAAAMEALIATDDATGWACRVRSGGDTNVVEVA